MDWTEVRVRAELPPVQALLRGPGPGFKLADKPESGKLIGRLLPKARVVCASRSGSFEVEWLEVVRALNAEVPIEEPIPRPPDVSWDNPYGWPFNLEPR